MTKDDLESTRSAVDPIADVNKGHIIVGRENLHRTLPPHSSYEGGHRFDPTAEWTPEEEKTVIRKTDWKLLTWLCLMVRS